MALETQVKNSCGEFTVFVDPDPLTYRSGEDIYTVQVINRTRTTRPQCGGPGGVPAGRRSERRAAMTTTDLTALFAALGIITVREAERRWDVKNMRQNGPDYPARVRLAGGRDWLTTEAAVRAVYGAELAEVVAEADAVTDGGRHDPAA